MNRAISHQRRKVKIPVILRKVVGHSMLPVLPPGTLVIGTKYFRRLKPGNIVVIVHDGKEKIKRVDQVSDDEVYVVGDHADASTDSRHFGWLKYDMVTAKIVWPRARRLSE